jgi:hypothetical protein
MYQNEKKKEFVACQIIIDEDVPVLECAQELKYDPTSRIYIKCKHN